MRGDTYLHRREIKRLGGKWSYEKEGWLLPNDKIKEVGDYAYLKGFYIEELDVDNDPFNPTIDEIRASRQERADRKAGRLIKRAESRERKTDALDKQVRPFISDIAFTTQPITPVSGGRAFARFREKINNKIDNQFGLLNEADELRGRAEELSRPVAVKGDAERRRQAKRDANDEVIKIGSRVFDYSFGEGEVKKVNKISYSIKFDRLDRVIKQDKSWIKLVGA